MDRKRDNGPQARTPAEGSVNGVIRAQDGSDALEFASWGGISDPVYDALLERVENGDVITWDADKRRRSSRVRRAS